MSNIKDCIYEAYNDKVGVLCNNEHERYRNSSAQTLQWFTIE